MFEMWCRRNGSDGSIESLSRNGSHRDRMTGDRIAARAVPLMPIGNADSMMVLSVVLAGQAGERF